MPVATEACVAFVVGVAGVLAFTPLAIRLAIATDFVDRPGGYKQHDRPTPYLGGLALVGAILTALLSLADIERFGPAVICVVALLVVGTVDDRRGVGPWPRVALEVAVGWVTWQAGLGWNLFGVDEINLVLTVVWVVGIVNAFNLMDNLDGACCTVGAITGATAGILAVAEGRGSLAAIAFGTAGACAGFLRFNLRRPAGVFLGDGGSMPLGFIAALITLRVATHGWPHDDTALLAGPLLLATVILDTILVTFSRSRRGVALFSGGRDHLTHRALVHVRTARRVALALAALQLSFSAGAVGGFWLGDGFVLMAAVLSVAAGVVIIATLEKAWESRLARNRASAAMLNVATQSAD